MMTSRERVIAALTFNHPDRAPRQMWALPYVLLFRRAELDALLEKYPNDIQGPRPVRARQTATPRM